MHDVLLIAGIAGLLALDDRAGWQSLLGEPVFSALLVGLATGQVGVALRCGVALQLAWLSIGAARGSRRPNVVVGGVVGAGAACLVLDRTGDPRELFVVATAVFWGLLAGEAGAYFARVVGEGRERWLSAFQLPREAGTASRNLALYTVGSALYVGLVDAVFVVVALPLAATLTEALTARVGSAAAGVTAWLAAVPALAIAAIVHAFTNRTLGRFAVLGLLIAVVITWLR
jgi:mannose/fructose/N-acetylgalactosamine-specific phosphotransferase system component IIC